MLTAKYNEYQISTATSIESSHIRKAEIKDQGSETLKLMHTKVTRYIACQNLKQMSHNVKKALKILKLMKFVSYKI